MGLQIHVKKNYTSLSHIVPQYDFFNNNMSKQLIIIQYVYKFHG